MPLVEKNLMKVAILVAVLFATLVGCKESNFTGKALETTKVPGAPDKANESDRSEEEPSSTATLDQLIEQSKSVKIPDGPVAPDTARLLDQLCDPDVYGEKLEKTADGLVETGDARAAWVILDRLRLENGYHTSKPLVEAFSKMMNVSIADCLLYTSPSPRDATLSRMPSSA